jgi:tetrahydromethanopterin S-methyltransferase subunit G
MVREGGWTVRDEPDLRELDRRLGRVEERVIDVKQGRDADRRLFESLRETQIKQGDTLKDIDTVVGGIAITVEKHTETLRDHGDMLEVQGEKLAGLETAFVDLRETVDSRFDSVDSRLDSVDSRLDSVAQPSRSCRTTVASRSGPTPTAEIRTPASSSRAST